MSNLRIDQNHPVVARLIELQGPASDKTFAAESLTVSDTVWYRVRTGKYHAEDHTRVLSKLTADLSCILDGQQITGSIREHRIIPLSHITESRAALNLAFAEQRNRIVIVLADTGGGKTMIAKSIARDFASRTALVEATESWRKSYLAGIQAIARVCGVDPIANNMRQAEAALIAHLNAHPRIIVIDEGNYFGPACLNLVKAIVNQTSSIVVILAMPVLWQFITRASQQEARQLRNRAAAILELKQVKKRDVALALQETIPTWETLNGSASAAVDAVTSAANYFGLWNTVFSIASFVNQEAGDGDLTLPIIQTAIADVQKLRR
jgi:DNA transposition AAA+ family ATPase